MRRQAAILTAVLLALAVRVHAAPPASICVPCEVVNCVDGDTVDVVVSMKVRVRFLDAWCPEANTPTGKAATDSLKVAIMRSDGQVARGRLHVPLHSNRLSDILTLNRVLGYVWLDGDKKSLSEQQVALGLASTTKNGELGK